MDKPILLNSRTLNVSTIADLIQAPDLTAGMVVTTSGYYSENDGGASTYQIKKTTLPEDKGLVHNLRGGLQAHLINMSSSLHVAQFGARGNGTDDDLTALKNCLSVAANTTVKFKEGATYLVSTFGIIVNYGNLVLEGNNATIKLKNTSGLLERMKNNTEIPGENICLLFKKSNIEVNNLNFDANADNNFFIHNGGTYYGYHQDLAVDGIPNKYITTYGMQSYGCDNITYRGCQFTDFGSALFIGETWDNGKTSKNFLVDGCTFKSGFRDQVVFFQSRNIEIKNCYFYDNQRKAIQFYQDTSDQLISKCEISVDTSKMRKWHPAWTPSHFDVELGGIGINNPNYYDTKYNCNNTVITLCKFMKTKFGAAIRNYSQNLEVHNNYFLEVESPVLLLNGVRGIVKVDLNKFTNCTSGVTINLDKHPSISTDTTSKYYALVSVRENTANNTTNLITFNDTSNSDLIYKTLEMIIKDNKVYNGSKLMYLNHNRTSASNKFIDIIQSDNYSENTEVSFLADNLAIRNANRKGKVVLTTRLMSEKPSAGYDLVKVATLETTTTLTNALLRGRIYNTNVSDAHYAEYVINIRSNSNIAWNSVVNAYLVNTLSTRPKDSIRIVEENLATVRKIHIYLYVPNSEGQTAFVIDNVEELPSAYSLTTYDSLPWLNNYSETISP
ncbi:hypothetical protein CEW46_29135, partial [Bacillus cereus]